MVYGCPLDRSPSTYEYRQDQVNRSDLYARYGGGGCSRVGRRCSLEMATDCFVTEHQFDRNLAIGLPLSNHSQHLNLPCGQARGTRCVDGPRGGRQRRSGECGTRAFKVAQLDAQSAEPHSRARYA